MNKNLVLISQWKSKLTKEDIITIVKYLIELINAKADIDDIDHLSNRRKNSWNNCLNIGVGLACMARTIRERMNVRDNEVFTPIDLINAKTLSSVINLSLEQTNCLSLWIKRIHLPITQRRLSALDQVDFRERAGFEV
jgi:DNA-directed RNA polymerase subunit beta